jgi:NDP-sugar pyrophosphorylase family protein
MPIRYSEAYLQDSWAAARNVDSELKGAILAAGLARRLDPLSTYHLPKPMFPLGGKLPISELWLRRLIRSGITGASMNLCVLAEAIKRQFGTGEKLGINLTFVEEETPTGTLGGVCKMALGREAKLLPVDAAPPGLAAFKGSTIIAPSGDIVANFGADLLEELYQIHRQAGAAFTIVLTEIPRERRKHFGTAVLAQPEQRTGMMPLAGRIVEFREKDANSPSCLSNASIYMIETELLRLLDPYRTEAQLGINEPFYDFGKHVFPALLGKLPYLKLPRDYGLWGVRFDGAWFDVGTKRDYLRVNELALEGTVQVPFAYEPLPWGYLGAGASVNFSGVEIRSPVVIGNGCTIESGATIGPYAVIGDGWVIERGSHIRHSILWERYPYYGRGGREIAAVERGGVDQHVVRGARIDQSIITGGTIAQEIVEKTVDIREDGEMVVLPLDHVPDEPRP